MQDFEGRVAVVTGAASGIGRALAGRLGAEGMKVALADVEAEPLRSTAQELEKSGVTVLPVVTDVARAEDVERLARRTLDAFGAVHLVCNNAGVFVGGLSWQVSRADYEWVLGVNVWGVIHGIQTFLPILLEQEEGHVLNTASMAAVTSAPFVAPYTMSKHAVLALSESLHLELAQKQARVGVSVLCPELVTTRIGDSGRNRPQDLAAAGAPHPERDLVENALRSSVSGGLPPERLADRALEAIREGRFYVLSEAASDGGWRLACERRLDDIRHGRNPGMAIPEGPPDGSRKEW